MTISLYPYQNPHDPQSIHLLFKVQSYNRNGLRTLLDKEQRQHIPKNRMSFKQIIILDNNNNDLRQQQQFTLHSVLRTKMS